MANSDKQSKEVRYSICITNFNHAGVLRESLDSILKQIDERFEVIVVDQNSTDGARQILQEYAEKNSIRLYSQNVRNRGLGRRFAFENASAEYIIANIDTDDVYAPVLTSFLECYHNVAEGKVFSARPATVLIGPRKLISKLGGWKDLRFSETWELNRRAARAGVYLWTIFKLTKRINKHRERDTLLGMARYYYVRYKENLRIGRSVIESGDRIGLVQIFVLLLARVVSIFQRPYKEKNFSFTSYEEKFFVDSKRWWPNAPDEDYSRERRLYRKFLNQQLL